MFNSCYVLEEIKGIENFNTDNVTNMTQTFRICRALKTLDLSKWNDTKVTTMDRMFQQCLSLETLDVSRFTGALSSNYSYWFEQCSKLKSVDLSNFNFSSTDTFTGMFNGAKIKNVGMIYSSAESINTLASLLPNSTIVYYMDAEPSELTTQTNITYAPYSQSVLSCSEEITLRSNGDVYDELDLLTGQVIQRIGEDNEILEEEIVRTVELDGEISFYENSYIHISSNEITPEFEFQPALTNYYIVSDLKPNTQYTVLFEGNPTLMSLGGTTIENPISKIMITSGEVDNILWFDTSVSKIMILEGDLTNRDVEYFTGVKSSQKIEVQLRGNTPYFAKGGRK
jgi:surface protein